MNEETQRFYGTYAGFVQDNQDPEERCRVQVLIPSVLGDSVSTWAPVAVLSASQKSGTYVLPEVETQVLVVFERGDVRFPYVIGSLWQDTNPPAVSDSTEEQDSYAIQFIQFGQHRICLKDGSQKTIEISSTSDKHKNEIILDAQSNAVTIISQNITLCASGSQSTIKLEAEQIELTAKKNLSLSAQSVEVKAEAETTIKGNPINLN